MTRVPGPPETFDTESTLSGYIEQLQDEIERLEVDLSEPSADLSELRQELTDLEERASQREQEPGTSTALSDALQAIHERIDAFERDTIDEVGGGPSEAAMENFHDAAGWHPDDE